MEPTILFEDDRSLILLERADGDQAFVRKVSLQPETISDKVLRFRNEFAYTAESGNPGIRRAIKLEEYQGQSSILLEYIDGETLSDAFLKKSKSIEQTLDAFIGAVQALDALHLAGVMHRDLNPRNLLLRRSDSRVVLIDFEKASRFDSQVNSFISFTPGQNNLSYIAPEQTGRVNRKVDARSDLYSLGITFFELFTGKLPYVSDDPLELIHFHLAREIPGASNLNSQVPEMISRILAKLMAKDAEDRYQTTQGLYADLIRCRDEFSRFRKIAAFELGAEDHSGKLRIPQQLFGREEEIKMMLSSFEQVRQGGTELLLVAGYSGIGKTALIAELYKPVTAARAYFVAGKFEQYQRSIPYFAILQAMAEFCNRLLTESEDKLRAWKGKIEQHLNQQGKVLTDLIPGLEKIIGPQPDVDRLENQESQYRLRLVFQQFIKSICSEDHPVVLFGDDLQWADVESLNLIVSLITEQKIPYLMVIGAYRDNEVNAGHPLLAMIERATLENAPVQNIQLKPLREKHVFQLIQETLQAEDHSITRLASLVFAKTQGNAFFIIEFLKSLYQQGNIRFDHLRKEWDIDFDGIQSRNITANVVDLLISNLAKMPQETQDILSKAACIGSKFDIVLLSKVVHEGMPSMIKGLDHPMHENYVIALSSNFEFIGKDEVQRYGKIEFGFAHDRIQQACYSLLGEEEKASAHLQIARYLEQYESNTDSRFDIVHHYNCARSLMDTPEDQMTLLKLNLSAAQAASESGSFNSAQAYIDHALTLSNESLWETNYELAYHLHKLHAELDYLNGKFSASETKLKYCLEHTRHPLEKSKLYFSLTQNHANQAHYQDAISTIREGLKELDFIFPMRDEAGELIPAALGAVLAYFQEHGVDSLRDKPFIESEEQKAIMLLLDNLSPSTYSAVEANLWTLHVLYKIDYVIKYGWTFEGIYAFTEMSILFNILNMFDLGAQCTRLAMYQAEKYKEGNMRHYGRTIFIHHNYNATFLDHVRDTHKVNPTIYQICLENGEMVFAAYISMYQILDMYYWGKDPLPKMTSRIKDTLEFLGRIKHMLGYGSVQAFDLVSSYLEGKTDPAHPFDTDRLTAQAFMDLHGARNGYAQAMYHLQAADALLLTGKVEAAQEAILKLEPLSSVIIGMLLQDSMCRLVSGLIYIDLIYLDAARREEYLAKVQAFRDQFALWEAFHAPNVHHKYFLLEAEWHSLHGQFREALTMYQKALHAAYTSEFNRDIGFIHMRLAAHWIREQGLDYALYHFEKAADIFIDLGYVRVVQHVQQRIKELAPLHIHPLRGVSKSRSGFTEEGTYEMMDVGSILKASHTLSEEIVYDSLIEKLLKIVNENIGGQRALLLTRQQNTWYIAADYNINQQIPLSFINVPLSGYSELPSSVIHFIERSPQIINNSIEPFNKLFLPDEYWSQRKYLNFVALPFLHKGNLIGILYVENTIDGGAFTTQRLETLTMLSSQMAVSLENANLYKRQSDLNKAYQKFVPHSFLETLGHSDILDVQLGDCIDEDMTVMFCDIRSYSTMAEGMTAEENFEFINTFLQAMMPAIREYDGYINHFLGDGLIALFKSNPESAIQAAEKMHLNLEALNMRRAAAGKPLIQFGIGLHTGNVMLGIIGDEYRSDANVLSDAVNLASRLEALTKTFNTTGIISGETYEIVKNNPYSKFRHLGKVKVKGRNEVLHIYEILTILDPTTAQQKIAMLDTFNGGLDAYFRRDFVEAASAFKKVLDVIPQDVCAKKYLTLSAKYMVDGVPAEWTGEESVE